LIGFGLKGRLGGSVDEDSVEEVSVEEVSVEGVSVGGDSVDEGSSVLRAGSVVWGVVVVYL
jgi:hypothetical protein